MGLRLSKFLKFSEFFKFSSRLWRQNKITNIKSQILLKIRIITYNSNLQFELSVINLGQVIMIIITLRVGHVIKNNLKEGQVITYNYNLFYGFKAFKSL